MMFRAEKWKLGLPEGEKSKTLEDFAVSIQYRNFINKSWIASHRFTA